MRIMDSVERLRSGLDYHLARHNVLTANLAHVDTPGYKPLDIRRADGFQAAMKTALTATNENHFGQAAGSGTAAAGWKVEEDRNAPVGADGNGVSLDREAVKIATNQIRYDTIAQLVSNELASLEWAANDGRNG